MHFLGQKNVHFVLNILFRRRKLFLAFLEENNYILLETELLTIKETLNKSLEDMEKLFQEAYNELTTNMAENLEKAWKSKLQQLLPLVDMKLNES